MTRAASAVLLLALVGCSGGSTVAASDAGARDASPRRDAGRDAARDAGAEASICPTDAGAETVTVVAKAHLTQAAPFVDVEATVPPGCWSSVVVQMTASSDCTGSPPAGQNWPTRCDPYDRLAQVTLADTGRTPMFLLDAVTSFGGSATWSQDVTDYASLLAGKHAYHLEIDTYSDATGAVTGTASSHDATVSIVLTPGSPPHDVLLAVPLLRADIAGSPDAGAPAMTAKLAAPKGATSARLDYFTSGHGGNGAYNCDEFCPKENDVTVDGKSVYAKAPTSDCTSNCTQVPLGTGSISCGGQSFAYYCKQNPDACPPSATAPRANWCPSQIISPVPIPLPPSALVGGHEVAVSIKNVDGTWPIGLSAVFFR